MARIQLDPKNSRVSEAQFAAFFGVPPGHSVRCIRYEAGMDINEWEHEERDASGTLVARYVTNFGVDGSGASVSCFRYGADGGSGDRVMISDHAFLEALP